MSIHSLPYTHELIAIQENTTTSSAIQIAHICVVVLGGRQPAFVLRLAVYDFLLPPFVALFPWIAIELVQYSMRTSSYICQHDALLFIFSLNQRTVFAGHTDIYYSIIHSFIILHFSKNVK